MIWLKLKDYIKVIFICIFLTFIEYLFLNNEVYTVGFIIYINIVFGLILLYLKNQNYKKEIKRKAKEQVFIDKEYIKIINEKDNEN